MAPRSVARSTWNSCDGRSSRRARSVR
jgi:hypothetical protein